MELTPETKAFWQNYLKSLANAEGADQKLYEAFRIGDSDDSAAAGARLIRQGIKTVTSSLFWEYQAAGRPLPEVGSLSIVEAGEDQPACIVETIALEIKRFADVDEQFAFDYGEWDRTLESWRSHCWEYYAERCRNLRREPTEDMPLVCERFRVIHP